VSDGAAWRVQYGNTFTRDISSLLDSGFKLSSATGYLRLRRTGNQVFMSGRLQRVASSGTIVGVPVATMPAGFQPFDNMNLLGWARKTPNNLNGFVANESVQARIDIIFPTGSGNYVADDYVNFTATWWTENAWPTTLPGV
jgi:hypothetical protein